MRHANWNAKKLTFINADSKFEFVGFWAYAGRACPFTVRQFIELS